MDFFIVIGWRTDFEQSGWAVGHCKHCGRHEAVRIGRPVTVVTLYYLIRLGRHVGEEVSSCDGCGEPVRPRGAAIPVANWSYKDGLAALFKVCAPDLVSDVPRFTSDGDLRALLRWVRRRSSLGAVDIGFGLFTGMWIGALLAIPFGFWLGIPGDPHPVRIAALSAMAGGFLGSVIGAMVDGLRQT